MELVGKHLSDSRARQSMIAGHLYVSDAMAVLADGDQVGDLSVLSVAVDVVDDKNFWSRIVPAIVAFLLVGAPSINPVVSGGLSIKRFFVPVRNAALIAAILSSAGALLDAAFKKIEFLIAGSAIPLFIPFKINFLVKGPRLPFPQSGALSAAKGLFMSMALFCNKFFSALFTNIYRGRMGLMLKFFQSKLVALNKFCSGVLGQFAASASARPRFLSRLVIVGECHG